MVLGAQWLNGVGTAKKWLKKLETKQIHTAVWLPIEVGLQ